MPHRVSSATTDIAAVLKEWMQAFTFRSWQNWHRYVRSSGLSMPQFGVMMHLHHEGIRGVSDIGSHLDITKAAASQLVDRLVQHGLVERREDPRDRRVRALSLTAKGRRLLEDGMEERYRWLDEVAAELGPEQRALLAAALPTLTEAARRHDARHAAPGDSREDRGCDHTRRPACSSSSGT